ETNIYQNHQIWMGHTRLAIQDLSEAGHQPMISPDGRYTLIFNGEVYNHLDLRNDLDNHQWNGHSDTETILHCWMEKGPDCIASLNGIFAIAMFDREQGKVYLARDPYGVKPLYFHQNQDRWVFGSELQALQTQSEQPELDLDALYQFLKLRYVPAPKTVFKGWNKLEPGTMMTIDLETQSTSTKFYATKPNYECNILMSDALLCYEELLNRAIERQLLADVPIAVLLSGGVDSALLVKIAQERYGQPMDTFTAGFNIETDANELEEARETSKILGTKHHEVLLDPSDFQKYFKKFVSIVEEPNGSSSIFPIFFLSEALVNNGFKVGLTGQGVDEPWNGYARYNVQNFIDKIPKGAAFPLKWIQKLGLGDKVRRGINAVLEDDRIQSFIESYSLFDDDMLNQLAPGVFDQQSKSALYDVIKNRHDLYELQDQSAVKSMSAMDLRMNLSDDLLGYTDKISMHHALELRVPFLDIELTDFVESLPDKFKVSLKDNKILHKKLSEKYLPKSIIYRKKKGFYTPQKEWLASSASLNLEEEMKSMDGICSDYFNTK
ncbi:MAG: asparagine synthase (glutamine-hydrolyzing), partial [Flavobacteriales bacterium]|nr:asparagine synthase (glutamine-hydrolyzing) [Flavobacteriales bacterium]